MERRILIRDGQNNVFRICKIISKVDRYDQPYLKFSFPDLHNLDLTKTNIKKEKTSGQLDQISFHYTSGIQTFKNGGKYNEKHKSLLNIDNKEIVSLFKIEISDLSPWKKFDLSKATHEDLLLNKKFEPKRLLMFTLAKVAIQPVTKKGQLLTAIDSYNFPIVKDEFLFIFDFFDGSLKNKSPFKITSFHDMATQQMLKSEIVIGAIKN